jgi:hypothetical protein
MQLPYHPARRAVFRESARYGPADGSGTGAWDRIGGETREWVYLFWFQAFLAL